MAPNPAPADGPEALPPSPPLQRAWAALPTQHALPQAGMSRAELEALLARVAYQLITRQPEALMQLLYRLDVDEGQAMRALELPDEHEQAAELARLMVDRELKRRYWRARYQGRG